MDPDLDVSPRQPDEIVRALETLLAEDRRPVDPWWRAGNDESLLGGSG